MCTGWEDIKNLTTSYFKNKACNDLFRYFNKRGNGEWLPNTLMPLSFDRASEAKIGVFYAKFNGQNGNNDHLVVRMVNKNRSNMTMYSIKLYRVGSASLFVSKLSPSPNGDGTFERYELWFERGCNKRLCFCITISITYRARNKYTWLIEIRDQPKEEQKCLGHTRNCRNVSAERPANWARPISRRPFRLISN